MTHKDRLLPHKPHMYTFPNYLTYVLYPPLYIAGPIMTFNDFLWQVSPSLLFPLN
jgi:D-alanyl-lipoteichoic acid acyltransferase DltB (MBOAT superfamily)